MRMNERKMKRESRNNLIELRLKYFLFAFPLGYFWNLEFD